MFKKIIVGISAVTAGMLMVFGGIYCCERRREVMSWLKNVLYVKKPLFLATRLVIQINTINEFGNPICKESEL